MNVSARSVLSFLLGAAVLVLAASAQSQPAGSDYTSSLPSVQKVETQLQGTDPTDTAARQVAVFEYLQIYIQRIRDARQYNGPYTPGELAALTAYARAHDNLTQSFKNSHSPADVTRFNQLEGHYSVFNALGWIKQLEGQQAADTYRGTEASLAAAQQRNNDRIQQGLSQANSRGNGDGPLGGLLGGGGKISLNASQKRCLELGNSFNQCAGGLEQVMGAIGSMVGVEVSPDYENSSPLNGVVVVGKYHSRTDLPEIEINGGTATIQKCGSLVDASHNYTIRKSSGTTQIVVENEPDPIVLTLRADGSLTGPGSIQVKGNIIVGYHNSYSCQNGNCTTSSTPVYQPRMDRCILSLLNPQPPPPPPPPQEPQTGLLGVVADLTGPPPPPPIYGFRMSGDYVSSAGLKLSFDNHDVTLDCGKAHIRTPYTVDNTASTFVVHVQNAGGAFLLALAPDNTLRGSGSTTVNGRLVSGVNGKLVNFTPHSESCPIGTFTPNGKQNTMVASNVPMPASSASYVPATTLASSGTAPLESSSAGAAAMSASLARAGISTTPTGARAQFRVLLSSSFNGTNPLAGQAVFVSRKPMNEILRELGVAIPANATPAESMKDLQTLCHSPQGCSSVMQRLPKYYVTTTRLDTSGKATLAATAATGQYYFFAIVPNNGGSLMWDLPVNLVAGDNPVSFSAANAERVE